MTLTLNDLQQEMCFTEANLIKVRDAKPSVFDELIPLQQAAKARGEKVPYLWSYTGTCRYVGELHDGHPVILLTYIKRNPIELPSRYEWWEQYDPVLLEKAFSFDSIGYWKQNELDVGFRLVSVQDLRRDLYEYWLDGHVKEAEFLVKNVSEVTGRKFQYDPEYVKEFYRQEYYMDFCEHFGDYEDCVLWDKVGIDRSFHDVAQAVSQFRPPSPNELVPWIVERDTWIDQLLRGTIASWTGNVEKDGAPILNEEQFFWEV